MHLYREDLQFIDNVIRCLEQLNEPEGIYLKVELHGEAQPIGEFEYSDGHWTLKLGDPDA